MKYNTYNGIYCCNIGCRRDYDAIAVPFEIITFPEMQQSFFDTFYYQYFYIRLIRRTRFDLRRTVNYPRRKSAVIEWFPVNTYKSFYYVIYCFIMYLERRVLMSSSRFVFQDHVFKFRMRAALALRLSGDLIQKSSGSKVRIQQGKQKSWLPSVYFTYHYYKFLFLYYH